MTTGQNNTQVNGDNQGISSDLSIPNRLNEMPITVDPKGNGELFFLVDSSTRGIVGSVDSTGRFTPRNLDGSPRQVLGPSSQESQQGSQSGSPER